MNTIALPNPGRPADLARRLVLAGLMLPLVLVLSADVMRYEVSKECRGAFSSGFGGGFDVHRCDMVIKRIGGDAGFRIPLPQ